MKKIILTALLSVFCNVVNAQVGLRIGATFANMYNKENIETEFIPGFNLGTVFNLGTQKITFKPGVIFTQKGYKLEISNFNYKLRINYIDIPLNVAIKLVDKVQFEVGPYIGYALNANNSTRKINFSEDEISRIDGGLNTGAYFYLKPNIQIGLSYNLGLVNINNGETIKMKIMNYYFNFNVIYFLNSKD